MILNELFSNPALFLVWVVAIILALSVHEFAHALAAYYLGDQTAKDRGRLTLNPMSHVSGMGFLMLLLVGFGWGKPVPFNPHNLKYKKWGPALVSIAGPLSNLIMAIFAGIILKVIWGFGWLPIENLLVQFLNIYIILNVILMIFNLIPIPPLDGSKILYAFLNKPKYQKMIFILENKGPLFLILLLIIDNFSGINFLGGLFNTVIDLVYKLLF